MPRVLNDISPITAAIPRACQDERMACEFLETLLWGHSPACPRCGDTDVYVMADRANPEARNRDRRWRCRGCKKQYTVRTGTIMEDSRIPLRVWCYAFWKACSSKKGVSALQIKRETGLSYKSALFLMHRVRWAMSSEPTRPLKGTVEVDETYIGGRVRHRNPGRHGPRTIPPKTPVLALVERGGSVRALPPERVTGPTLKDAVRQHVDRSARIMTDDHPGYKGLADEFAGGHETVRHSHHEYARGDVTTNTVEGFFSLLKRGVIGTFHHISKKHLGKYVSEFEFRYNHRKVDDGTRTVAAIRAGMGKRLTYVAHIA